MNKSMTLFGCGPKLGLLSLPYIILSLAVMYFHPEFLQLEWLNSPAIKALGSIWLAAGTIFWIYSAVFFLKRFKPGELLTSGPFAFCRNPIYASIIIFIIPGLGIIFHSGIILSIAVNLYIVFKLSIHGESAVLRRIFTDRYADYEKSVNQIFPFPWFLFRPASIALILLLSGNLSAQNNNQVPLQKTGKIKLLNTEDFRHADIGNPAIAGTVTVSKEGFDITAGGADIWGVKDEFNFVYIEKTGDFDFAARVESLTATHQYTKAGLMAREDLTPGSRHIYFQMFPNNMPRNKNNGGFEYQYREVKDGQMKAIYPARSEGTPEFPVTFPGTWIRLKRQGNRFTGYTGTDGKTWKEYATYTLGLPEKVYLGAAVTSHNTTETTTAKFRNIGMR